MMGENVYDKRVKQILTRDAVTLSAEDTIHEALALMGENCVSALPVVDRKNRCIGILSTGDLVDMTRDTDDDLRQLDLLDAGTTKVLVDKLAHSLGNEKVQVYMTDAVTTVGLETPIARAAREMLRNHVHHLPVVDGNDCLMGIVSTMDILSEFADAAPD
ncbi:CBS domain-containing protein [Saprospiraceae bacterium]|nr:CBS domain-containing protein [Saprospiraceae bacterium]